MPAPPSEEVRQVVTWVQAIRAEEIKSSAGDPGVVPARRLSNAEYNYTIRDLTGQDMQLTREFPVDPANTAGFDNSAESLTMSPALLNKYLNAARQAANRLVLTPDAILFAPYPMLVETDRDKYAIQRILAFYAQQPTDYAQYFQAAWRFRYRKALREPRATLATVAAESRVSSKYLLVVWKILHDKDAVGPVLKLQKMWLELPAPGVKSIDAVKAGCVEMRDFVVKIRTHTAMQYSAPRGGGVAGGFSTFAELEVAGVLHLNRRHSDPSDLRNETDPPS